jgi:DNA repair protein RecO (recombination protein O)
MHKWESQAIILSVKKFAERDLLVNVFALGEGLHAGIVKAGQSKTKASIYQQGNLLAANWSARLHDQLGIFTAELEEPIFAKLMNDRHKLQALLSITSILRDSLAERDEHDDLYFALLEFLRHLCTAKSWVADYVKFEIEMLRMLGFGLDLSECAVTGMTFGLEYISPKTGRAVTAKGASGYEKKLLKLPKFLLEKTDLGSVGNTEELSQAFAISSYFLQRHIYNPQHKHMPDERERLVRLATQP